jgi:lysophospholipase
MAATTQFFEKRMIAKLTSTFKASTLLTDENQLRLQDLWQQGTSAWFQGQAQCRLHYRYWLTPNAQAALVIVPGRIEATHKYLEVCADAVAAGYQVFIIDHRGQGCSDRLSADRQIGLVLDFNHYIADLALWFEEISTLTSLPLVALAHSMGGAILAGYLQNIDRQNIVLQKSERQSAAKIKLSAAIFCSPMWGLPTAPMSSSFARSLASSISKLNQTISTRFWYVPGQGPYHEKPFADNDLTTCPERYQWFRQLYKQYPEYQIGGVSWTWLACALTACQGLLLGTVPQLPMLLLQAEQERVVDNDAQDRLWQHWRAGDKVVISQAEHELLCGEDWQRQQVYQAINQFLANLALSNNNNV